MLNNGAADVLVARRALATARADLDEAVAALPEGEDAMATPNLCALLFRAVEAKDSLNELELELQGSLGPSLSREADS